MRTSPGLAEAGSAIDGTPALPAPPGRFRPASRPGRLCGVSVTYKIKSGALSRLQAGLRRQQVRHSPPPPPRCAGSRRTTGDHQQWRRTAPLWPRQVALARNQGPTPDHRRNTRRGTTREEPPAELSSVPRTDYPQRSRGAGRAFIVRRPAGAERGSGVRPVPRRAPSVRRSVSARSGPPEHIASVEWATLAK
jgi:hypothetical protein